MPPPAAAAEAARPDPDRVVFIDVDGVLNTRPDPRQVQLEGAPCAALARLLEASGAELVLTSRWRRHHAYVTEVLAKFGVFGSEEERRPGELRTTPRYADATRRDLEVLQWLNADGRRARLQGWVVIDAADLLRGPSAAHLEGHVVRPDPGRGLTLDDVSAALRALGCPSVPPSPSRGATEAERGAVAALSAAPASGAGAFARMQEALPMDEGLAQQMQALLAGLSGRPTSEPAAPAASAAQLSSLPGISASLRGLLPKDTELAGQMEALLQDLQPRPGAAPQDAADSPSTAQADAPAPPTAAEAARSAAEYEEVLAEVRASYAKQHR